MSVKVGFLNDKYTYENLNTKNNILRLNSFNDSNIILLNHDLNSTQDVFLNFKNIIGTGLSSNDYFFRDIQHGNSNIMTINSCNISLDKPVFIQEELYISDVFSTSNGTIKMTSNTEIHLISPDDSFTVFSSNDTSKILFQTNDFCVKDFYNSNRIQVTDSQIDISSNLFISHGTLFVDKISSIGASLNIENASYSSTEFESLITINSFDLINSPDSSDKDALTILKNYGNADIVSINTCNISTNTISNNFTIDNNGLIGVGTKTPAASVDIRNVNDNIMLYDGERTGDLFKMTREGDIGIGTSVPKAQLHIKRNDDSIHPDNDDNRRNPLFLCDIDYDNSLNTSNVYVSVVQDFIYLDGSSKQNNMKLYLYDSAINIDTNNIIMTYYLLNDDILNEVDVPEENKLSAVIDGNYLNFESSFNEFAMNASEFSVNLSDDSSISVNITNIIKYPRNYIFESDAAPITFDIDGAPSQSSDTLTITNNLLMSHSASDNDYGTSFLLHAQNNVEIQGVELTLEYNLLIHNTVTSYSVKYDVINNVQIPCPNFMHMLYNDTFISSLSASGALSLGEEMPELSNHLLYVKGSSMIDDLDVKNIYTNENVNCNISFMNTNLTDINTLQCTLCDSHEILAYAISDVYNLYSSNAIFSNMTVSNIVFEHCENNYLSFAPENIHLNTKVNVGDTPNDLTSYDTEIEINVSDRVTATNFSPATNNPFLKNIGMSVSTLSDTINPCISVSSFNPNAVPSMNINNTDKSYNFRIRKMNDNETRFQLTSDNIHRFNYYDPSEQSDATLPSIIQHTLKKDGFNNYSVLTFGEQNIMNIDCKNKAEYESSYIYDNFSSKITMGIPYALPSVSDKTYVSDTFASSFIQEEREYLLNVFGNISISDICDYPMMTMKSLETEIPATGNKVADERQIFTAINGEPDMQHNLCVHGDIACDDIRASNHLYVPIFNTAGVSTGHYDLISAINESTSWDDFKSKFSS